MTHKNDNSGVLSLDTDKEIKLTNWRDFISVSGVKVMSAK